MLVGCFLCQQDYTKTAEQITIKPEWKMNLNPGKLLLTFAGDPDQGEYHLKFL